MLGLAVSILMLTAAPGEVPPVAGVELRDQHGETDSLAAHRGEVVVAMVVTARRLRNLRPWERDLKDRLPEVSFLRIADVPEDPPVTYEKVARKLAKRVPEEISILIDLERRWSKALDLDTDRPNLLLIDRQGRLVEAFRGRHDPELADRVSAALEGLVAPS
jgi:hypothetical protein